MAAPMSKLLFIQPCKKILKYQCNFRILHQYYSTDKDKNHYDLIVIGGGSGGLSCAKQASQLDKKVAVLDYVSPTPHGATWGLGGTCVNVGCIPKKLMHHASLLGGALDSAKRYGWDVPENIGNNWEKLTSSVQGFIRSINWGYRVQMKSKHVDYHNAMGYIVDKNTVKATLGNGKEQMLTTDNIVLSMGMRPKYLDFPGAKEYCISSDDIFSLKKPPGKTLCIGASYVSLECAGFLTGLGYETTVMMRSIPLRGFDRQCSELVLDSLQDEGTRVINESIPVKVERTSDDRLRVRWENVITGEYGEAVYDTVMLAIGRIPGTTNLGLEEVGVNLDSDLKVIGGHGDDQERTSVSNIYAIGDILKGAPELTPVAMLSGKLLARRLFSDSTRTMNYNNVATTVFTPLEYSSVGMCEESAIEQYGEDNLEVYHAFYKPLEFNISESNAAQCYIKAITERSGDQKVLGLHFLGPNAGEVMQGFSVAMRCGMTYPDLQYTVGIHPTCAEEITKLNITKRSGLDPVVTSC